MKTLIVVLAFSVPVLAQRLPPVNVVWFAEPVVSSAASCSDPGVATFFADEADAPYIRIVRAEGDFIHLPSTPFDVDIYKSLWLALEPYAKLRARGRDAWVVTLSDQRAALVRRK